MAKGYIYQGRNSSQYADCPSFESFVEPSFTRIQNGVVLPAKADPFLPWGKGGILDSDGSFVAESALDDSFGAPYQIDFGCVEHVKGTVIYLGIVPKHWGHFLIDVVCKLWPPLIQEHRYKIVYCGLDWGPRGGIDGVYSQLLGLAGVRETDLLFIEHPTRFEEILIPSRTLGFAIPWNRQYLSIIKTIVENAELKAKERGLCSYEKLYLSRCGFIGARRYEVGEEDIEELFRSNGFKVIHPEALDAVEQIHLYYNCSEFASLSGTLAHNLVFSHDGVRAVIMNRTWALNPPQIRINQMMGIDPTYIDVYHESELKRDSGYKAWNYSVHLLSVNENLRQWCYANKFGHVPRRGIRLRTVAAYQFLRFLNSLRMLKHRIVSNRS